MNIFISHAAADRSAATRLADSLKSYGFAVTNPLLDAAPGDNVALKVGKALEDAAAMVVLLSPDATKSEWVQHEIGYALSSPQFEGRLIPVMLRPTSDIPWILHDLNILAGPSRNSDLSEKIAERLQATARNASGSRPG